MPCIGCVTVAQIYIANVTIISFLFLKGQSSQTDEETKPAEGENEKMSEEEKRQMEEKRVEEEKKKRPLIPKSTIMRLLAELVKSYTSCAQIVTQHAFIAGQSEIVPEV